MKLDANINLNTILIGAGIIGAVYIYRKFTNPNIATDLADGLSHPMDSLSALFKSDAELLEETSAPNGTKLTPEFSAYIKANGGIDAYIRAHKNGTFNAQAFQPKTKTQPTSTKTTAAAVKPMVIWAL